jgi:hypothetical protein
MRFSVCRASTVCSGGAIAGLREIATVSPNTFPRRATDLALVADYSPYEAFQQSSVKRGRNLRDFCYLLDAWTAEQALEILGPEQDLQQSRAV